MLTGAGSGYSGVADLAVTRWREDVTRDDWGSYIFLRDVDSGAVWSAGYQPTAVEPDSYEVTFTEDRAEFIRVDGDVTTTIEVVVSAEDDAEVRRVSIANTSGRTLDIEVTSYSEVVLAPRAADAAHQAFSKLFVQTEFVAKVGAILATRRRRCGQRSGNLGGASMRSSRARSSARRRSKPTGCGFSAAAAACARRLPSMDGRRVCRIPSARFSIRCLRCVIACAFASGHTARIAFWTLAASSRAGVLDLRRQASRWQCLHARRNTGMDAGAGAVASPRYRCGGGRPLSATGRPGAVRERLAAAILRHHPPRRRRSPRRCGRRASPVTCPSCSCASTMIPTT